MMHLESCDGGGGGGVRFVSEVRRLEVWLLEWSFLLPRVTGPSRALGYQVGGVEETRVN
jgi:hypothetical protein